MSRLVASAVLLLVSAAMLLLLGTRLAADPLSPYGEQGAEFLEHADRLKLVETTRQVGLGHPVAWLEEADRAFPPGIHLLGAPWGAVFGHDAVSVTWSAPLWLLLLALAVGSVAASLDLKVAREEERRSAFVFGAVAALMLPAAHAAALRYHYDLPMTALLWCAVALQLRFQDKRPFLAGSLAGLFLFLAAATKWSALPLGVPLIVGAAIAPRRRETLARSMPLHYRAWTVGAAGLVSALLVGGFLAVSMESLLSMAGTFEEPGGAGSSLWSRFDGGLVEGVRTIVGAVGAAVPEQPLERLITYVVHVGTAMLSPLGVLLLAAAMLPWLATGASGLSMAVVAIGGQLAFLVLGTPPMDERFLLPSLPFVALAAAGGCRGVEGRGRQGFIAVLLAGAFFIAWDFHHGPEGWWNRRAVVRVSQTEMPQSQGRRFMLASSFGARGWVRRDEQRDPRMEQRQQVWQAIADCGARNVVFDTSAVIDMQGDGLWWQYRGLLAQVQRQDPPMLLSMRDPEVGRVDPTWAVVVTGPVGPPTPAGLGGPWVVARALPEPGGRGEVRLWVRDGSKVCR
ncbi:MAG: hypothetical protein KDA24_22065 [Deltaproteobacteria bacterium]|nr:hypothetical protein [Deltaproteobacteria bacterium]